MIGFSHYIFPFLKFLYYTILKTKIRRKTGEVTLESLSYVEAIILTTSMYTNKSVRVVIVAKNITLLVWGGIKEIRGEEGGLEEGRNECAIGGMWGKGKTLPCWILGKMIMEVLVPPWAGRKHSILRLWLSSFVTCTWRAGRVPEGREECSAGREAEGRCEDQGGRVGPEWPFGLLEIYMRTATRRIWLPHGNTGAGNPSHRFISESLAATAVNAASHSMALKKLETK